jgi:hypothetical protein
MLPSQDAMIFSIATSVRLYAIGNPLLNTRMPISVVDWGKIRRRKGSFNGVPEFSPAV